MDKPNKMVSRRQAALQFGVCVKTIDKWILSSILPAYKFGDSKLSLVRIKQGDIDDLIEQWKMTV